MRDQVIEFINQHHGNMRLLEIYDYMLNLSRWYFHKDSDVAIDLFVLRLSKEGITFETNEIDSYIYGSFGHPVIHSIPDNIYAAMDAVGWPEYSIRVKQYSKMYSDEDFIFNLPNSSSNNIDTITPINVEKYINSMKIPRAEYIAKFKNITRDIDLSISSYILKLIENEDNLIKLAILNKYEICP